MYGSMNVDLKISFSYRKKLNSWSLSYISQAILRLSQQWLWWIISSGMWHFCLQGTLTGTCCLHLSGYSEDRHNKFVHNTKFLADYTISHFYCTLVLAGTNKVVISYHTSVLLLYCQLHDDNYVAMIQYLCSKFCV